MNGPIPKALFSHSETCPWNCPPRVKNPSLRNWEKLQEGNIADWMFFFFFFSFFKGRTGCFHTIPNIHWCHCTTLKKKSFEIKLQGLCTAASLCAQGAYPRYAQQASGHTTLWSNRSLLNRFCAEWSGGKLARVKSGTCYVMPPWERMWSHLDVFPHRRPRPSETACNKHLFCSLFISSEKPEWHLPWWSRNANDLWL